MPDKSDPITVEIPKNLRSRQLIISCVFAVLGILWVLSPRPGRIEWSVLVFFLILLSSMLLSWLFLPTQLVFTKDKLILHRVLNTKEMKYEDISRLKKMTQMYWWGRKYPAFQLHYFKRRFLITGFLAGSQVEDDVMDSLKKFTPHLF